MPGGIELCYGELYRESPEFARLKILATLEVNRGNVSKTAREMGTSRDVVYRAIEKHRDGDLDDRSSRPHTSPNQIPEDREELVIDARKKTRFGKVRLKDYIYDKYGISIAESTLGNVITRNGLSRGRGKRRKNSNPIYYKTDGIQPFERVQIDLKVIEDFKTLPDKVYAHVSRYKLPKYQWTAIDEVTRTRFLAYSFEKSFSNGLTFMTLIAAWIRAYGFKHPVTFQSDRGQEFGGTSPKKRAALSMFFEKFDVDPVVLFEKQKEKNGKIERNHRTDDKELYIPYLTSVKNTSEFLELARKWCLYYNSIRRHYGHDMQRSTPQQRMKQRKTYVHPSFFRLEPVLLDMFTPPPLKSVGEVADYYR